MSHTVTPLTRLPHELGPDRPIAWQLDYSRYVDEGDIGLDALRTQRWLERLNLDGLVVTDWDGDNRFRLTITPEPGEQSELPSSQRSIAMVEINRALCSAHISEDVQWGIPRYDAVATELDYILRRCINLAGIQQLASSLDVTDSLDEVVAYGRYDNPLSKLAQESMRAAAPADLMFGSRVALDAIYKKAKASESFSRERSYFYPVGRVGKFVFACLLNRIQQLVYPIKPDGGDVSTLEE